MHSVFAENSAKTITLTQKATTQVHPSSLDKSDNPRKKNSLRHQSNLVSSTTPTKE